MNTENSDVTAAKSETTKPPVHSFFGGLLIIICYIILVCTGGFVPRLGANDRASLCFQWVHSVESLKFTIRTILLELPRVNEMFDNVTVGRKSRLCVHSGCS